MLYYLLKPEKTIGLGFQDPRGEQWLGCLVVDYHDPWRKFAPENPIEIVGKNGDWNDNKIAIDKKICEHSWMSWFGGQKSSFQCAFQEHRLGAQAQDVYNEVRETPEVTRQFESNHSTDSTDLTDSTQYFIAGILITDEITYTSAKKEDKKLTGPRIFAIRYTPVKRGEFPVQGKELKDDRCFESSP